MSVRIESVSSLAEVDPAAWDAMVWLDVMCERKLATHKSLPSSSAAAKPFKAPATAAGLPTTTEVGTGVIIQCVQEGSKLRARVVSDGYDPNWNIRFPRSIRDTFVAFQTNGSPRRRNALARS